MEFPVEIVTIGDGVVPPFDVSGWVAKVPIHMTD